MGCSCTNPDKYCVKENNHLNLTPNYSGPSPSFNDISNSISDDNLENTPSFCEKPYQEKELSLCGFEGIDSKNTNVLKLVLSVIYVILI